MKDQLEWLLKQISSRPDEDPEIVAVALEELKDMHKEQEKETSPTITEILDGTNTSESYRVIKEFMQKAGQDTPETLTVPNEKVRKLRAKLILEEALETIWIGLGVAVYIETPDSNFHSIREENLDFKVMANGTDYMVNIIELIDGCCDLQVVTKGTLIAFGVPDTPFQREVDKKNLEKFEVPRCPECNNKMYLDNGDIDDAYWYCINSSHTHPLMKQPIMLPKEAGPHLRSDGKLIKGTNWTPPKHTEILHDLFPDNPNLPQNNG